MQYEMFQMELYESVQDMFQMESYESVHDMSLDSHCEFSWSTWKDLY